MSSLVGSSSCAAAESTIKIEKERDLRKSNTRGQVIIRNNVGDKELELDLEKKFADLDFCFSVKRDNHTVRELRRDLYKARDDILKNSSYFGSIIVIVISHQDADGRLQMKNETYTLNEITTPFLSQEYAEIPTIFLFYICGTKSEDTLPCPVIKAPNCIVCVSPYEGYFTKLTEVLPQWEGRDLDFTSLLCKINGDASSSAISEHLPLPILMSSQQKRTVLSTQRGQLSTDVSQLIECYDLSNSEKPGLALIFNCHEFNTPGFSNRNGSHSNVSQLSEAFHNLEFTVNIHNDLTKDEFITQITNIGQSELSSYGCVVVSVMTHSENNLLYFTDGEPCKVSHVWEHLLNNETLKGKPKLFFIEASASNLDQEISSTKQLKDCLISYACLEYEYPWRNTTIGCYFSNAIGQVLENWKGSDTSILTSIIEVNHSIGEKEFKLPGIDKVMRQTPCFISFLYKDIKYSDPPEDHNNDELSSPAGCLVDSDCVLSIEDVNNDADVIQKLLKKPSIRRDKIERKRSQRRKPAPHMLGLLDKPENIVEEKFKDAIMKDETHEFEDVINKHYKDNTGNIKFLAKHLLQLILEHNRVDILEVLLKYDLPQGEVLSFVYKLISESTWKTELLEKVVNHYKDCNQMNVLRYHFNMCHNRENISGFPIMCVLKNEKIESDNIKLIQKIDTLLRLGANINDRYEQDDEKTPVHFAAARGIVDVVLHLLKKGADIDIVIAGKTARELIRLNERMKELNLIRKSTESTSELHVIQKQLFKCLYEKHEKEFLTLFASSKDDINVDIHDGKYTLLQLAIKNNLKDAAQELINQGANRSAMGGYCKEPVLIALEDSKFESLDLFAQDTSKLDLRFCNNNSTFLHHLAIHCGKESVLILRKEKRELLENLVKSSIRQYIHLSAINDDNETALLICSENDNILLNILLDHGGFLNIDETIAEKLQPTPLAKYLDSKIQYNTEDIELNFQFLKPLKHFNRTSKEYKETTIAPEMDPFYELCNYEKFNEILANSPIVTFFLMRKWTQFAFVYIINFLLRVLFIVNFSSLVYLKLNHSSEYKTAIIICHVLNFIFWFMLLSREIVQMFVVTWQSYIRNFENYVEIPQIIFILISQIFMLVKSNDEFENVRWVISIAVILTYIDLTLLAGKHPSTEIYVRMFKKVSFKTLKLLGVFSSFILAFAFGFYIIFLTGQSNIELSNNTTSNSILTENGEKNADQINFSSPGYSILKTSVMLLGEFDLGNLNFSASPYSSEILIVIFLILVPIVLMNVLNALAISDTKLIIDAASVRCCISKIKLYATSERVLLRTSNIKQNERCYGFDIKTIQNSNNSVGKLVLCIAECFQALKSPISNKNHSYKITVFLPKKRDVNFEIFQKFYERIILQINEVSTANEFVKANAGKNKKVLFHRDTFKAVQKQTMTMSDNYLNETINIRAELQLTRNDLNDAKKEIKCLHEELKKMNESLQLLLQRP